MNNLLTLEEVSKILRVSQMTLKRWEKQGKISCLRMGPSRARRFRKEDIDKIINPTI